MRPAIVLLLTLGLAAGAQHAPERTPGRVGGSTNNPQAHRPAPAHAAAVAALSSDEQQEYRAVLAAMPDATPQVFHQLRFISDQSKALGKQIDTVELAKLVAKRHGDAVGALRRDVKLSGHDAKKIFNEALQIQ